MSDVYEKRFSFDFSPRVISQVTFGPLPERDQELYNGFFIGLYYVTATTLTFVWAIIGAQVFRTSVLGAPWGMLLVGIGLNAVADVSYYYTSIYYYDRTNPIIGDGFLEE